MRSPRPSKSWPLHQQLSFLLDGLAERMMCEVKDLRLDHDPPLAARPQHRRGLNPRTFYTPDANDPDHLFYRPHGAQFAGSHDIKTRVRGDHGQYSDIQLIKRERRRQKRAAAKKTPGFRSGTNKSVKKRKWASRPFPKRRKP